MYRITFDPKISRFVVQILVWHCFWRDCRRDIAVPDTPVNERITFGAYRDAVKWVTDNGLKDAYREAPSNVHVLYPEVR